MFYYLKILVTSSLKLGNYWVVITKRASFFRTNHCIMFSAEQELEFNVAYLEQMVIQANSDIESWQKLKEENDGDHVKWTDHERRPPHVVIMHAWTKQFVGLLDNRIQQNKLKQKEMLEMVRLPAEWAVLRFQQNQILSKMNDIHMCKTRMACKDLKEKLLGPQQEFGTDTDRGVKKSKSKPTKNKSYGKVKIVKVLILG